MPAGRTLAERETQRAQYRQKALAQAALMGLSVRCQQACQYPDQENLLVIAEHRFCRGEQPGGAGCLCTCHDKPDTATTGASS